jgi:hypothetical protein
MIRKGGFMPELLSHLRKVQGLRQWEKPPKKVSNTAQSDGEWLMMHPVIAVYVSGRCLGLDQDAKR